MVEKKQLLMRLSMCNGPTNAMKKILIINHKPFSWLKPNFVAKRVSTIKIFRNLVVANRVP